MSINDSGAMHVSPKHFCGICGWESNLNNMVRQRGILVDTTHAGCYDAGSYVGERDKEIARLQQQWGLKPEPRPHSLLVDATDQEDEVNFNI